MKPLSLDLRRRIVRAYERGEGTQAQIAQRFEVGRATVERLVRLQRETGALDPKPHAGGAQPRITEADRESLIETFEREPDLRQEDLADRLTAEGRPVSRATVGRALPSASHHAKKKSMTPEQQLTDEVQAERTAFTERLAEIDPARIKVVDESGGGARRAPELRLQRPW